MLMISRITKAPCSPDSNTTAATFGAVIVDAQVFSVTSRSRAVVETLSGTWRSNVTRNRVILVRRETKHKKETSAAPGPRVYTQGAGRAMKVAG